MRPGNAGSGSHTRDVTRTSGLRVVNLPAGDFHRNFGPFEEPLRLVANRADVLKYVFKRTSVSFAYVPRFLEVAPHRLRVKGIVREECRAGFS